MRIAIATDAWAPQVSGVVTTLTQTRDHLIKEDHEVLMVTNEGRKCFPLPTYPEIKLALFPGRQIARELDAFEPDCVHIATEGTIGLAARRYCIRRGIPFTTAYHTKLPEYVRARFPVPVSWTYALLRWFHGPAARTMVPTESLRQMLQDRGFEDVVLWTRGVLTDVFRPDDPVQYDFDGPVWVYFGRVAVEKNIEAFLDLSLPGTKVVIGDGPDREKLSAAYPDSHFLGYKFGRDLARHVAGADVFVFPSKTDTFGVVMLEAMACGVPVAAYPVTGPIDVVKPGLTGCLHDDLTVACSRALELNRWDCRQYAESRSWRRSTRQFICNLAPRDAFAVDAKAA
jgi:glycosyltransferase involved in cell wall biosynthesis